MLPWGRFDCLTQGGRWHRIKREGAMGGEVGMGVGIRDYVYSY